MTRQMRHSHAMVALLIALPLLCVVFIALLLIQQQEIGALQQEKSLLDERIVALEGDVSFYKSAYRTTLEDIRQLSRIYGGQRRYEELAREIRKEEVSRLFNDTLPETTFVVTNSTAWQSRIDEGLVTTACLGQSAPADAFLLDVVLSLVLSSETATSAQVWIDATNVANVTVDGVVMRGFAFDLPDGEHEIALVADVPVRVEHAFLDATPLTNPVIDHGTGWDAFDCEELGIGGRLDRAGAIRYFVRVS